MKLRPLGDRVILKYQEAEEKTQPGIILPDSAEEKTQPGIILPDSAKEKPQEAMVVAVGNGMSREGKNIQIQVKEGDRVIFSKYAGTEVKMDEEEYTIVSQKDIMAVVE